jgi:toxin HigB-1
MLQEVKRKKFKHKEIEEYLKGGWFKKFSGIENVTKARRRLRMVAESENKKDFAMFSGIRLELISGAENHYSIRINRQWRIFFIWENNQAWEIDLSKHDYKKLSR